MATDFEIGRVVQVDTAQVSVELNGDLLAMSRSTYEGPHEVGRINSYIIIPVAASRLVGVVTRVVVDEDTELMAGRAMVALPASRRVLNATLIGTINGDIFEQGVSLFPVLDSPVYLSSEIDLDAIFGPLSKVGKGESPTPGNPKFCISIGQSGINPDRPILIDPDAFFGKHAAILGSTGAGKSCTIASIIQSILERSEVKRSTFIIIDTNGEYNAAFPQRDPDGGIEGAADRRYLYIPSDSSNWNDRLTIPYWFMNVDDFVRLFQAAPGVQRPVLLEALRLARNDNSQSLHPVVLREELVWELNQIWSLSNQGGKNSKGVRELAEGLKRRISFADFKNAWDRLRELYKIERADLECALDVIANQANSHVSQGRDQTEYTAEIPADTKKLIHDAIEPLLNKITSQPLNESVDVAGRSADSPFYFSKHRFRSRHIEQVLRRESSGGGPRP